MLPETQLQEIIRLVNPESAGPQMDAVFLVKQFVEKTTHVIRKHEMRASELEAEIHHVRANLHDVINDKLVEQKELRELRIAHDALQKEFNSYKEQERNG